MVVVTRPLRGSRLSSFFPSVPIEGPSLSDLDSAFQLQEYIALLIRQRPHDVEAIITPPGRVKSPGREDDKSEQSQEKGDILVDEACWIYEQLRRLAQDLTHPLITSLQQECSRASCPEMKAGEWLYLCVAHGNDGAMEQCCAIDYIIHTLDSATALLNSPRAFPSRISIPQPSIRHFSSLARRLGRIFAHAYFHHREAFESAEGENSLYARFLALTARFDLVPPEFLVIPPRMTNTDASSTSAEDAEPPRLLGAALNPQPPSPDKPGLAGYESPRKVGRNRTDTMVFSDAEAYSEALRGHAGSPPVPETSSEASDGEEEPGDHAGGLGLSTSEGGTEGIPHVDKSEKELVADSPETCLPMPAESDTEAKSKPYTLTFSASGTMKAALPPGVSSSSTAAGNTGLSPSAMNSIQSVPQLEAREYRDSIEERVPPVEGDEESALDSVLGQEEEDEDGPSERSVSDLLARTQRLMSIVQELHANEDDDITDWVSNKHAIRFTERAETGAGIGEVPERRQSASSITEGDFVVVGERGDGTSEKTDTSPEPHENEAAPIQSGEEEALTSTETGDADQKAKAAPDAATDNEDTTESENEETSEGGDSTSPISSSPIAVSSTETPSESQVKTAVTDPEEESQQKSGDPNTSLETDLADVEKALHE